MLTIQEFTLTGASHRHQGLSRLVKLRVSCWQRHVGTATLVTMHIIKSHDCTTVNMITYRVHESVIQFLQGMRMVHVLMWWHRTFGVGIDSVRFLTLGCLTLLQAAIPDLLCLGAT